MRLSVSQAAFLQTSLSVLCPCPFCWLYWHIDQTPSDLCRHAWLGVYHAPPGSWKQNSKGTSCLPRYTPYPGRLVPIRLLHCPPGVPHRNRTWSGHTRRIPNHLRGLLLLATPLLPVPCSMPMVLKGRSRLILGFLLQSEPTVHLP